MFRRNSTTIFITSPGAITPLPWVNNAPDFSGIEEPTLSVLISSWNAFLVSGEELEIIPESEPIPQIIAPNWQGFGGALLQSAFYENHKTNGDFQTLVSLITVFAGSGDNPNLYPALQLVWDKFKNSITLLESEITEVNENFNIFNIPFTIDITRNLVL